MHCGLESSGPILQNKEGRFSPPRLCLGRAKEKSRVNGREAKVIWEIAGYGKIPSMLALAVKGYFKKGFQPINMPLFCAFLQILIISVTAGALDLGTAQPGEP